MFVFFFILIVFIINDNLFSILFLLFYFFFNESFWATLIQSVSITDNVGVSKDHKSVSHMALLSMLVGV